MHIAYPSYFIAKVLFFIVNFYAKINIEECKKLKGEYIWMHGREEKEYWRF